jgi:hypothetical protein
MSVDVANANADIDASGTSRQANMSRRPAVNIVAIAAAAVGNTAKGITISFGAELATQVDMPNTTPIDNMPARSSAMIQRGVV